MASFTPETSLAIQRELRTSRRELLTRGLNDAASWVSEQLVGIVQPQSEGRTRTVQHDTESDTVMFAKTLFDMKEYARAVKLLEGTSNSVGRFLRCYALFLAGEKRKEERITEMQDKLASVQNRELPKLLSELDTLCRTCPADGPLLYLYGLVLYESGKSQEALEKLIQSVKHFPCNWSACRLLCTICAENEQLIHGLKLPDHWISEFIEGRLAQLLQRNQESLKCFSGLRRKFPRSTFVLAQQAMCSYETHDFDEAEQLFEELLGKDPYRLSVLVRRIGCVVF